MLQDDDQQLEILKELVYKHDGLDCRFYKQNYLKRRLAVRVRARGLHSFREYNELLQHDPGEFARLVDRLTINVSQFFRDPTVFQALQRSVLPALAMKPKISVWSAGCAAGEEPYSLSMLFAKAKGTLRRVSILATDIDTACLQRAQAGIYKDASIANVSPEYRRHYLEKVEEGWAVRPEIKSCVVFRRQDLTAKLPVAKFDLIVCRNVLIYFNRQLQERLYLDFHECLYPGGFLVLGKTEVLLSEYRQLYSVTDIGERIYQLRKP